MPAKLCFLDSNVILYAYGADPKKKRVSTSLLKTSPFISTQVIDEVCHVCRRKLKLSFPEINALFTLLQRCCQVESIDCATIASALSLAERYHFSYFDSLILASALEHSCDILYSEDLQHRQMIEGSLTIINPFL